MPSAFGQAVRSSDRFGVPAANVQVFTASGTWTKPANGKIALIECWGGAGGGAGGTMGALNTPSQCAGGGGGAGGGYGFIMVNVSQLATTVVVTVGAGGTGGGVSSTGAFRARTAGTNGGSTTFTGWVTANPGTGADAAGVGGVAVGPAPMYVATYDTVYSSGAGRNGSGNGNGGPATAAGFYGGAGGNGAGSTQVSYTPITSVMFGTSGGTNGLGWFSTSGAGTAGGDGGMVCGGGGGGNGADNSFMQVNGAGGAGGSGYCRVTVI